tara:strand:+ start:300 stop:662 length:363 start_codon:yes stop_codon:yes gene_type:complete
MEGAIDVRLIITVGGILFSVAGAAAIGKMQIKVILENLADIEKRLRGMDRRIDALDTSTEKQEQRINILAQMSSPENLRRDHMASAAMQSDIQYLKSETVSLRKMHNGVHPPVASERQTK